MVWYRIDDCARMVGAILLLQNATVYGIPKEDMAVGLLERLVPQRKAAKVIEGLHLMENHPGANESTPRTRYDAPAQ